MSEGLQLTPTNRSTLRLADPLPALGGASSADLLLTEQHPDQAAGTWSGPATSYSTTGAELGALKALAEAARADVNGIVQGPRSDTPAAGWTAPSMPSRWLPRRWRSTSSMAPVFPSQCRAK